MDSIRGIFEFVATHDLIGNVDPVQYSIRLLVPEGSLLLGHLPGLGAWDPAKLSYPWTSPLDALQAEFAALVEARADDPVGDVFNALRTLVDLPPVETRHVVEAPRLSESWFCCAEPTDRAAAHGVSEDTLPAVSETAVGVALIRGAERERPDPLFVDPLAPAFAAAAKWSPPTDATPEQRARGASLVAWIALRTKFLDDLVRNACAHGCGQVVLLAAGLDARAFRLGLAAEVRLFELDLPGVLAFKDTCDHRTGRVVVV